MLLAALRHYNPVGKCVLPQYLLVACKLLMHHAGARAEGLVGDDVATATLEQVRKVGMRNRL